LEIQNLDKQPEKINWIIPDGDKLWIIADYKVIMAEIPLPPDSDDNHLISGEMLVFDRPELELRADHPVYMIASDGDRNLYFRTFYGVYRFNTETRRIDRLYAEDYGQLDWGEGNFQSAMKYDQDGILWVGTDKGLLKITLGNENFHVIKPDPLNPHGLNHPKLNDVLIDRNQNLWVGTVGDGLYRGIPDNFGKYQNFEHYMPDPGDPFSLQSTGICRLFEDSRGDIWFLGETIQRINTLEGAPRFLPTPFPKSGGTIKEDPQGNILVPDIFSLCWVYNPNTGKTYPLYPDKTTTNYKNSQFIVTNDKSCYFMIQNALFQFHGQIKFSEETGEETGKWTDNMIPFAYPERTTLLLDSNAIGQGGILVTEHADYKEFWITRLRDENLSQYQLQERNTINGENDQSPGIKMDLVNIYSTRNGLTHGHVFEIIEDDSKRIWCPTQNGLTCIDPATGQVYRYYKKDGLPTNKFYWGYHKDRNGIIYLCTTNGLVYFHPDSIVSNSPPPVFLTGLRLFNQPISVGNNSPLEKVMMHTDRISLSYNQNFISFEFAALDLRNPAQVRYQYKMEGLDHDWVDAENRRRADYSGMRPGRYTFQVIAANSNGVWNREGASVEIFISRPLWYSWWAFSAYVILLFLILLLIRRFEKKRAILKTELRIERIDKEKTLELDKMKSRFYTNISHEFRTPLALLLGPIDDGLKTRRSWIETERGVFEMMKRNAKRLQRLINQMLDLSKLETGKVKLQVAEGNLSEFVRAIVQSFLSLGESKKITYDFDLPAISHKVYFDSDKLEKILTNLISNAFKFTPENGEIGVSLKYSSFSNHQAPNSIEIKIRDSGKGIPQDQVTKIFDRFFQISSSENREEAGTGIGLALTKELVDLFRGEIQVESKIGQGSTFTVILPVSKEQFEDDEIVAATLEELEMNDMDRSEMQPEETIEAEKQDDPRDKEVNGGPVILVVEDNADLRNYISGNLGDHYQILVAENGRIGLSRAIEQIPDLVISDLMMPEMNGMEMCKRLKADERTNHIPIVMLTAIADRGSKLEGLETGADDYIIKPFDAEELRLRVKNLVEQRRRLREKFKKEFAHDPETEEDDPQSVQDQLLAKIFRVFDQHIDNSEFSMGQLAGELNVSRAQLFRKVAAITDHSPHALLQNIRLKKAAGLFRSGHNHVAQVMHMVGFNSQSHFGKCFSDLYGKTPSQFIKQHL
jgi:signal transduction histidine kinase/DNA-binding response OmpR family regulator/ligand-binding sensor domain-containing protein